MWAVQTSSVAYIFTLQMSQHYLRQTFVITQTEMTSRRIWAAHVARMGEIRNAYEIFVGTRRRRVP
jgi:hypothetical protein